MSANADLLRFIDSRMANYPNGISKKLLDDLSQHSKHLSSSEMRLLILIREGDKAAYSELIQAIVSKGLKLSMEQVETIEVGIKLSPEMISELEKGRKTIACLGLNRKELSKYPNLCLSYDLKDISSEIEKKREFWKELQKFIS